MKKRTSAKRRARKVLGQMIESEYAAAIPSGNAVAPSAAEMRSTPDLVSQMEGGEAKEILTQAVAGLPAPEHRAVGTGARLPIVPPPGEASQAAYEEQDVTAAPQFTEAEGLERAQRLHQAGQPAEAFRLLEEVIEAYPSSVHAPFRAGMTLRILGRFAEANTLLQAAFSRIPNDPGTRFEYARVAEAQRDWVEALYRWTKAREQFPDLWEPISGIATALRELQRYSEAEALLSEAVVQFPDKVSLALDFARLSEARGDYNEALRHWLAACERFPEEWQAATGHAACLTKLRRFDEADSVLVSAQQRRPDVFWLYSEHAKIAEVQWNWSLAAARWTTFRERFPEQTMGWNGGLACLREAGLLEQFDLLLQSATNKFPQEAFVLLQKVEIEVHREQFSAALETLARTQSRFPHLTYLQHRIFEVRLQMLGVDGTPEHETDARRGNTDSDLGKSDDFGSMYDFVMQFESLGGTPEGCEFGLVQRAFGAEPLGLMRWTQIRPDELAAALEARFEGVGLPENTELHNTEEGSPGEYGVTDRRFLLRMHTWIKRTSIEPDKMLVQTQRRMQFLARELIEDLEHGDKIFVYKNSTENLTDQELARIHRAMRRYSDNTLLYVRYADHTHPNGTVSVAAAGLLIGYIDRFKKSQTEEELGLPTDSWLSIMKEAYRLWTESRGNQGQIPMLANG